MKTVIWISAFLSCALVSSCLEPDTDSDAGVDAGEEDVCIEVLAQNFDADTVLKKGCYLCQRTPRLGADVRLTFEPGVKIVFDADTGLEFVGNQVLIANGTAADPILLTGSNAQRGHWRGVRFDGTLLDASSLAYVTIEHAGATRTDNDAAALKLTSDSRGVRLSVSHTTLRDSQGWGLWLGGAAVLGAFTDNTLTQNTLGPAKVESQAVHFIDATSTFSGNDRNELVVKGGHTGGTWAHLDVPYFVETGLEIDGDWTIEAGTTLKMEDGSAIDISGDANSLVAVGTASTPIVFTSETAQRGAWQGITFDNTNNNRNALAYVTVEYTGDTSTDRDMAAVRLVADSHGVQLHMSDTTLRESEGWGLFLTGSAVLPDFSNNILTHNTLGPVSVGSEAVHQLLATSFYTGNDIDKVVVRDSYISHSVSWMDLGVPYRVLNQLVPNHAVLSLEPGVTLLMDAEAYIDVGGDDSGFNAVGTADAPISITSLTQTSGDWAAIIFDTTLNGANVLDYCNIEWGGGGAERGWHGMIIARSDSHGVNVSISNSTLRGSSQYCLWQGGYANVSLTNNTFVDCASGDIFIDE